VFLTKLYCIVKAG